MIYHTSDNGPEAYEEGTSYGSFRDLPQAVLRAVRTIEPRLKEFDMIAVQGVSGMCLGFPLALKLGVDIVVVRKPGETNHFDGTITGTDVSRKRLLFVDDFVSGGSTRNRVREALRKEGGRLVAEYTSRDDAMLKS